VSASTRVLDLECSICSCMLYIYRLDAFVQTLYSTIHADRIPDATTFASPRGDSWQADCIVQDLLHLASSYSTG
jgi:hypothetical protein